MEIRIAVIAGYFMVVLLIGFFAKTRWRSSPEEYFLAGRGLRGFVLLGTMAATNFSAFTVFGASGAGYRDGYAFFPIVGFGTGFMALTFWIIGKRAWEIGKERGAVTPAELVGSLYGNPLLSFLFAMVMIVFTIPYIALQPMAGGYVLKELFDIPQGLGATLITLIIVLYVFRGGLRAVAWTDVFQGLLMVALMITALIMVSAQYGGFELAHSLVRKADPALMSRPGPQGRFTPSMWFSFMMLWFFCDPMFPQLFQRFFSARDPRAIRRTMLSYPLVCTLVFFLPVTLGVLGHISFPDLVGKEADRVLPMMLRSLCGDFMGTLIMSAGLAALMSTMDSQLLTLSSIFSRDVFPLVTGRKAGDSSLPGKVFVPVLAALGLIFAVNPPSTILHIATQAFTGLAVLFPTVFFGLYLKRPRAAAAILSILAGESMVVLSYLKLLPSGGFLPAVPIIGVTFLVYLVVTLLLSLDLRGWIAISRRSLVFGAMFALLFGLAVDWWEWTASRPSLGGFPYWMGYFIILSILQTFLMNWWLKGAKIDAPNPEKIRKRVSGPGRAISGRGLEGSPG
ncbi:MAG: sodium:solute symporter family protein [Deltaproteobacteria bacterium]|nr:sodium:solute symporter family protein [Deltaproteobacteria bacterium]MBW2129225.1 sodium:solute symporter family protein [Deltaproteobacteria bacterium]MBW2303353.1 sodium:solute symporter family protein [Deltaproteobacteria bacterium]